MIPTDLLILIISSISIVGSFNCNEHVTSIPVCSDDFTTSNIVYLSGVREADDTTKCSCSLSTGSPTNVTITSNQIPHGCYNKLQFLFATTGKSEYTCRSVNVQLIRIQTDEIVKINLCRDDENATRGFAICLQIKSASSSLTLSCGKSRWSITSSKPDMETSSTESITPTGDEYKQLTSKQPTTPNSGKPTSARESDNPATPTSKNDNSLSAIIGGSVGGLVVIIIIIITMVICVIRKRRKDKNYGSPEAAETDVHPYQNIPDNRSREITHQPKHNNELVHQENDPYTIIDNDIIKPCNDNQEMEYLENDLYISSNDVIDDVVVDDKPKAQRPVVAEYAQVNKSNANKTTNGKCKTGPKGDNYAVVNKGGKMINNDNRNEQIKIGPSGDQYAVVTKEGKKNNGEGGTEFKLGPSGDQYAVVNKGGGRTNN